MHFPICGFLKLLTKQRNPLIIPVANKGPVMNTIANIRRLLEQILTTGGIAGLIAIIIAITICVRYAINGPEEIPHVLTYSLTTIIGFYFGLGVKGGSKDGNSN